MRCAFHIATALVASLTVSIHAATVNFNATLDGASERPDPVATEGSGSATAQLTGEPGSFVLTYNITYENLTGPAIAGHIHDAINPGGLEFTEQFGPVIHPLDSINSPISGDWRFDDATDPLTDDHVTNLLAGRFYINIHTDLYPNGEIRGQLVADAPPPPPPVIPLPAPVFLGAIGLGLASWATRRRWLLA